MILFAKYNLLGSFSGNLIFFILLYTISKSLGSLLCRCSPKHKQIVCKAYNAPLF